MPRKLLRFDRSGSAGGPPASDEAGEAPASRDVAQAGSAPPWGGGGRGFESRRPDQTFSSPIPPAAWADPQRKALRVAKVRGLDADDPVVDAMAVGHYVPGLLPDPPVRRIVENDLGDGVGLPVAAAVGDRVDYWLDRLGWVRGLAVNGDSALLPDRGAAGGGARRDAADLMPLPLKEKDWLIGK